MIPKRFVLTFLFDPTVTKVVLIRKTKPDWMAGKLNAVGGHVEDGETFIEAAVREFREETGFGTSEQWWHPFLRLFCPGDNEETLRTCECYWAVSKYLNDATTVTDEQVAVFDVQSLLSRDDIVKDTLWILVMAREAAARYADDPSEMYGEFHDKSEDSQWKKLA